MQERDDPLSLHENDSEIEFTDQAPTWEQLYKEIETSRAIEFNIITPWSSKDVLQPKYNEKNYTIEQTGCAQ